MRTEKLWHRPSPSRDAASHAALGHARRHDVCPRDTSAARTLADVVLAAIQFTRVVDFMVLNPLGPQLMALLRITDAQIGLLVSAYTLAAGASGLLATFYSDRFDRKTLLLCLYGGFALTTLGCGLAPNHGSLMAACSVRWRRPSSVTCSRSSGAAVAW